MFTRSAQGGAAGIQSPSIVRAEKPANNCSQGVTIDRNSRGGVGDNHNDHDDNHGQSAQHRPGIQGPVHRNDPAIPDRMFDRMPFWIVSRLKKFPQAKSDRRSGLERLSLASFCQLRPKRSTPFRNTPPTAFKIQCWGGRLGAGAILTIMPDRSD